MIIYLQMWSIAWTIHICILALVDASSYPEGYRCGSIQPVAHHVAIQGHKLTTISTTTLTVWVGARSLVHEKRFSLWSNVFTRQMTTLASADVSHKPLMMWFWSRSPAAVGHDLLVDEGQWCWKITRLWIGKPHETISNGGLSMVMVTSWLWLVST